jgi:hypothetical protein
MPAEAEFVSNFAQPITRIEPRAQRLTLDDGN